MTFEAVLARISAALQQEQRISYRALKRRFELDDDYLEAIKDELIHAKYLARDENGTVLVWAGADDIRVERRQLTVMFCDLVNSTGLSVQLDPEELREVIQIYQQTCADVINHFDGYVAQYLGDGLLVYFGYPQAHEDDAQRAVRAGLRMLDVMGALNKRLQQAKDIQLAVRIGIHTGLVVVGDRGSESPQVRLAFGETLNIASRLQGLAAPDTLVISAATYHLVQIFFVCEALGTPPIRGVTQPIPVYRVLQASDVQHRLEIGYVRELPPLVGRDTEQAVLQDHWRHVRSGVGKVVLLCGEAGIGKSRLVQAMKAHVAGEPHSLLEYRCSPYHHHSAFYPVIDLLHRTLHFAEDESPDTKLEKLATFLSQYRLALEETVPLFAALLSLPCPEERYPPLTLPPPQQRRRMLECMLTIWLEQTTRHPVLIIVEDLMWVDPSTLELLDLLVQQASTARLFALLTSRPTFQSPWTDYAHVTHLVLNPLPPARAEQMIAGMTGEKTLPPAVIREVVVKTDGIPLFIEEMTKMVLESGWLHETEDQYELTEPLTALAIPATIHDSLMARLDRLGTAKAVAQLGATIGRTVPYALLQALTPLDEAPLQHELTTLVEAELLYPQGVPPHITYVFKHALVQDAAYQSLLKRTRQQYHQQIAQLLEARFPETIATQPELIAHHYTEAGDYHQAIDYWQRAGQRALQRSASLEAIGHLRQGLKLLSVLPESSERAKQELEIQITLGPALIAAKGHADPEVEGTYARAQKLCQQVGETPQLFSVVWGLWRFYNTRGTMRTSKELGEWLLHLAQSQHDPACFLAAYTALGTTLCYMGEFSLAYAHLEQRITLPDPAQRHALAVRYGVAPDVQRLSFAAQVLWFLGYPQQALQKSHQACALAQELAHSHSLVYAQYFNSRIYQLRRETRAALAQSETTMALASAHAFPLWLAASQFEQGWVLTTQDQDKAGLVQMRESYRAALATGAEILRSIYLILLAEACGKLGQIEEGLQMLDQALTAMNENEQRSHEAEAYRLKGELLQHVALNRRPAGLTPEACLLQALDIARRQQSKSWELRASISLSRLWQRQGKREAARQCLATAYDWFTEGFDTTDLQEAKALLEELRP